MSIDYQDFALEIGEGDGQTYPVRVNTPVGPGQATLHFPFSEQELENRLLKLENVLLTSGGTLRRSLTVDDQQVVQSFGAQLFEMLFAGEIGTLYDASKRTTRQVERGLRIKLRIQSPKLAALPWELLYDKQSGDYICLSRHMPLIRYLDLDPIQPLPVQPPLQILGMVVSPSVLTPLDVAKEKQQVERSLATLQKSGHVKLTWLEGQTWRELQNALQQGPCHIFHFIGHGSFSADQDKGQVAFADEEGRAAFFDADDLGRMLGDHFPLRLVFLNSCEGARSSADHLFSSTAAALVRRGTPAVLAMQYPISDNAAIQFSETFYSSLAHGLPVDAAVSEARKAIGFNHAGSMEWVTPVLYMRANDGRIFAVDEPRPLPPPLPSPLPLPLPVPLPKPKWLTPRTYQISGSILVLFLVIYFLFPVVPGPGELPTTPSPDPGPGATAGITPSPTFEPTSQATLTPTPIPTTSDDTATYIHIPAGELQMGTSDEQLRQLVPLCESQTTLNCKSLYAREVPQHPVAIQTFWIMQKEVTNEQYLKCYAQGNGPCTEPASGNTTWQDPDFAAYPITHVNWEQARIYAAWAGGRLPTEAEWEMACRSTDDRLYPWGNELPTRDLANYAWNGTQQAARPVGSYPAGTNELFDMAGNVWEWTSTLYTENYAAQQTEEGRKVLEITDDAGARVMRGGSFAELGLHIRCAYRSLPGRSDVQTGSIGFRVARDAP